VLRRPGQRAPLAGRATRPRDARRFDHRRTLHADAAKPDVPRARRLRAGRGGPRDRNTRDLDLPIPERNGAAIRGEILYIDQFGNLATNIEAGLLPAAIDHVEIAGQTILFVNAYAEAERGSPLALVNSWGVVEIAVRDGSARALLGADVGAQVTVIGA
jgi:S-adenosylmethionine hydrolase